MPIQRFGGSIRARFLIILIAGAMLPLAIAAWWLGRTTTAAAEQLVRAKMDSSLTVLLSQVEERWDNRHGYLRGLTENEVVLRTLTASEVPPSAPDSQAILEGFASMHGAIDKLALRATRGSIIWNLTARRTSGNNAIDSLTSEFATAHMISVEMPITGEQPDTIGVLQAELRLDSLVAGNSWRLSAPGVELAVFDAATGRRVLGGAHGFPHDTRSSIRDRLGKKWIVASRAAPSAPFKLALAAPAELSLGPFTRATQAGVVLLTAVAVLAILASVYFTTRVTRSLENLALATNAVAAGDLNRIVDTPAADADEVNQLATAFNSMTRSLRKTLDELSQREKLAAVGEFASSLSHEVRNGLSAIRMDLQRLEETALSNGVSRELVARSLNNVTRLNTIVTGALGVARSGRSKLERVDLCEVVRHAASQASGAFNSSGASLSIEVGFAGDAVVEGDGIALEHLFLNLMLNAAQAMTASGRATVQLITRDGFHVVVIADTGPGMARAVQDGIRRPFNSSKRGGTGLGLSIATKIAEAHGGTLAITSDPAVGTTVEVSIPRSVLPSGSAK